MTVVSQHWVPYRHHPFFRADTNSSSCFTEWRNECPEVRGVSQAYSSHAFFKETKSLSSLNYCKVEESNKNLEKLINFLRNFETEIFFKVVVRSVCSDADCETYMSEIPEHTETILYIFDRFNLAGLHWPTIQGFAIQSFSWPSQDSS